MEKLIFSILAGGSIGWLVGLSTSPVLAGVLTTTMSILATIFVTASPSDPAAAPKLTFIGANTVTALKAARLNFGILVLAMAIGATTGLWARTHDLFSPSETSVIDRWTAIGLDKQVVASRVFDAYFPEGKSIDPHTRSVLFDITANECRELLSLNDPDLRNALLASTKAELVEFAKTTSDNGLLKGMVERSCKK
jgi:hypothetical protein